MNNKDMKNIFLSKVIIPIKVHYFPNFLLSPFTSISQWHQNVKLSFHQWNDTYVGINDRDRFGECAQYLCLGSGTLFLQKEITLPNSFTLFMCSFVQHQNQSFPNKDGIRLMGDGLGMGFCSGLDALKNQSQVYHQNSRNSLVKRI